MTLYLFGPPGQKAVHKTTDPRMVDVLLVDGFVWAEVSDAREYVMPARSGEPAVAFDGEAAA